MFLEGLDELDQKIVQLLIKNARISYSEIGSLVGISGGRQDAGPVAGKTGRHRRVYHHYQSPKDQRSRILLL